MAFEQFASRFSKRAALRSGILALVSGLAMAFSAAAGDGIGEINQASALAGGGFPVTLADTGSYKLTSNLTVSTSADAIVVTGIDVYLDLNGFSIIGPAGCSSSPPVAGTGSGVVSTAPSTTVANGSVRGFGARGISLVAEGRVAGVRVRCAGVAGIRVGGEGRVEQSAVSAAAIGVETGSTSLLIDNEITSNTGFALDLGAGSAIRSNVLVDNNGGNANPQIQASGGIFELGLNRCGIGLTCSVVSPCGNGSIDAGEICDDGGTSSGDGCSAACFVEIGWECSGTPSVCVSTALCGDAILGGTETCDDGNNTSGDGCGNNCIAEPGFYCTGEPSVCATICGDNIALGVELCDGFDLNGQTCGSFGFSGGTLACTVGCQFDVNACIP